jgi:CRISPR-associated protein Cas2
MKYLITYDIENDKKRKKISDELEAFGYRVNYSVFECELNQSKLKKLKEKLEDLVDEKYDSLRFYHICENCIPKSFELCKKKEIFEKEEFFI